MSAEEAISRRVARLIDDDLGELLLVPGPVSVSAEVQLEVERAVRPHYGAAWVEIFDETTERLRKVFDTEGDVILFFGPGSAGLETVLRSCLNTSDVLLVPSNGIFGDRLAALAEANEIKTVRLGFEAGEPLTVGRVLEAAQRAHATALALVYSETGAGILNPIREICEEARRQGLFVVVDAVSALGGVQLNMDAWGIDVCVAVGNKCLGAPVGISPIAVTERAWIRCGTADIGPRGRYFNLQTWRDSRNQSRDWHPHPATMPTAVMHAVCVAAGRFLHDKEDVLRRHAETAAIIRTGLRNLGFQMYIDDDRYASPVVTAAFALDDMDMQDYINWLASRWKLRISPGIGTGDAPVFRVGHMGLAADPQVAADFLDVTQQYLETRVPF